MIINYWVINEHDYTIIVLQKFILYLIGCILPQIRYTQALHLYESFLKIPTN